MRNVIIATLIVLTLIARALSFVTPAHAETGTKATVSITRVQLNQRPGISDVWVIDFSNGVRCSQRDSRYVFADNPHVGTIESFAVASTDWLTGAPTTYAYQQANEYRPVGAAPMECNAGY